MKQLSAIWMLILIIALVPVTAFGQAEYTIDGANPLALALDTGTCQTVTIILDPSNVITTPLVQAGFWLVYDPAQVTIGDVVPYDWNNGGPWEPMIGPPIPPDPESGTYWVAVGNPETVPLDDLGIAEVEFCCEGPGQSQITISTIPEFDTVVGGTTVWDSQITDGIIDLRQFAPACSCDIIGPVVVPLSPYHTVTEQYVASPGQHCIHPPNYVWLDDCDLGDVDQSGLLIIPPTTGGETCTITVVDSANTDINTGEPVQCGIPIQLISPP